MPVGRHRHAINVRADGLASVLGPLLKDDAVLAALLVDVDSGMVLDSCGPRSAEIHLDQEQLGAVHGDLMRLALGPAVGATDEQQHSGCELVISHEDDRHLVLRRVPDPHGDRLALSVLVSGPARALRRTRRRLREVSAAALTAGPTTSLRPTEGEWVPAVIHERPPPPARSRPRPRPRPAAATLRPGPGPGPDPVSGPALAALAEPIAAQRRLLPDAATGGRGLVPVRPGPAPSDPEDPERRPAPPSALPPPAQRSGDGH